MKFLITFTIFVLWNASSFANIPASFAHRFYDETESKNTLQFGHELSYKEVEFEDIKTEEYLDLFDSKDFDLHLEYKRVFKKNYQLGLGLTYTYDGELKKRYQESLAIPNLYLRPKGLKKISLVGGRTFVSDRYVHTVKAKFVGGPSAKEDKSYYGGFDLLLSYHFIYMREGFSPFVEIYNIASFPKKLHRVDGEIERQRAFSEVFLKVGSIYNFQSFYLLGSLGFGLMTDYEIESPSYKRIADKGFRTYWQLGLGQKINKSLSWQSYYARSSQVYNSKNYDPDLREVDYEIETDEYKLELIWAF